MTNELKPAAPAAPAVGDAAPKPALLAFLEAQRVPLLTVTAVVVIVCAGALVWTMHRRQALDESFRMLTAARAPAQWEEIIQRHPGSPAAPMAMLALASWRYHAGEYDAATQLYQQFNAAHPRHDMRHAAELGLAMCMEARGETQAAMDAFDRFIAAWPDNFMTPQALFGKARCLIKAQRFEEARFIYENFIMEHPDSAWNSQAEMALNLLQRETPTAPVNPPAPQAGENS